jgi:8-oxo-dGTP pyrophosphatase MutT (NUDIX family)
MRENKEYWGSEGAGILAIATDTGKWLVAHRSSEVKQPNCWGVVGGKVEENEKPSVGAKREFHEETGYDGSLKIQEVYNWVSPDKNKDGSPKFVYHNFLGEIEKGSWEPETNFETKEFKWCTYEELLAIAPKHFGLDTLLKHRGKIIEEISQKYKKGKS